MKKIFLTFITLVLCAPILVSADSYDGPYCFEKPSDFSGIATNYDGVVIRGTCKEVEAKVVVSLDSALKEDYFLGIHTPIEYDCERFCEKKTTYSEYLFLTSSSTLEESAIMFNENPIQYALFGKAYFVPLLSKMFKESGISFSENTVPNIGISIFKKSELDEIKKYESDFTLEKTKMDFLETVSGYAKGVRYIVHSLNYQEYGKHIYAPKGTLIESQYADFERGNMLSNKDLQVNLVNVYYNDTRAVVPITSPLKSVTNYWLYTKKNGKLVLAWQKSEYGMDDGSVKTITNTDKNVSATLLFSGSPDKILSTPSAAAVSSPVVPQKEQKRGVITRFFNFILSWFR